MSTVENEILEIDFGEVFLVPRMRRGSEELRIEERSEVRFELNRKPTQLGSVGIDQWWIPLPGLYADRKRESRNYQEVLACFWGWSQHAGSARDDRRVQESFILANLLPEMRSNGARRVFLDAFVTAPTKEASKARYADLKELEFMLSSAAQDTLSSEDFTRQTADILGPSKYDAEARECYREMTRGLFDEACAALESGDATGIRLAVLDWRDKVRTISRRGGKQLEKQVMNVLSYEARAAFHRAYSATWHVLIEAIKAQYGMSHEEEVFHRLWHFDHSHVDPAAPDVSLHLFHGHIFGLHPAFGDYMLTSTGAQIIGDVLSDPTEHNYQRMIRGLLIAVFHYDRRYDDTPRNRPTKERTVLDIESTHASIQSRRRGSRRLDRQEDG